MPSDNLIIQCKLAPMDQSGEKSGLVLRRRVAVFDSAVDMGIAYAFFKKRSGSFHKKHSCLLEYQENTRGISEVQVRSSIP